MLATELIKAWKCRKGLAKALFHKKYVETLDVAMLEEEGIGAIVLDHDGVLGPNRSNGPDGQGEIFINKCLDVFGSGAVFVLSNTSSRKAVRIQVYGKHYPDVIYLVAKRKPDHDGLRIVSHHTSLPMEKIAVVDDGLMKGITMAVECGARPIYAIRLKMEESISAWIIRMITTKPQLFIVRLFALFSNKP
ncbi:MAG TPA: hypothetical protein QF720_03555 [Nitrospinota bacterium]|nr:hypothetical protein [Nitrospinota bacterium]|tara:strand:- start:47 stop:619 length:573 start_codon:yes stop_codon:yes gene_type:complete